MKNLILILATLFGSVLSAQTPQFPLLYYGYTAGFQATITNNGTTLAYPAGYTPVCTWTASDPSFTVAPQTNTTLVNVSAPATSTTTTLTLTVNCTAPSGPAVTEAISVPVTAAPANYGVTVTQLNLVQTP